MTIMIYRLLSTLLSSDELACDEFVSPLDKSLHTESESPLHPLDRYLPESHDVQMVQIEFVVPLQPLDRYLPESHDVQVVQIEFVVPLQALDRYLP